MSMNARVQGHESGAVSAGELAKLRGQKLRALADWTPFDGIESLLQWLEEGCAGSGDAAADDDGFGIENVDQAGNGAGEIADGFEPNGCGFGIAIGGGDDEIVCAVETAIGAGFDGAVADGDF